MGDIKVLESLDEPLKSPATLGHNRGRRFELPSSVRRNLSACIRSQYTKIHPPWTTPIQDLFSSPTKAQVAMHHHYTSSNAQNSIHTRWSRLFVTYMSNATRDAVKNASNPSHRCWRTEVGLCKHDRWCRGPIKMLFGTGCETKPGMFKQGPTAQCRPFNKPTTASALCFKCTTEPAHSSEAAPLGLIPAARRPPRPGRVLSRQALILSDLISSLAWLSLALLPW